MNYIRIPKKLHFILLLLMYCLGCKKSTVEQLSPQTLELDILQQSITYRTIAVIPSPADSANNLLQDSISVSRIIRKNEPDFLTNIPNVNSNLSSNINGFSFGYDDPNNSLPYFTFTTYAFPNVPREFELNHAYEHKSIRGTVYQRPLFLGSHDGFNGMTYFVNNVYPPDAGDPTSQTFTKVTFTEKTKVYMPSIARDTFLFASGKILGYCIDYFNPNDTTKYVHRWDFSVDFNNLRIDKF
jgi:hypothetical protein